MNDSRDRFEANVGILLRKLRIESHQLNRKVLRAAFQDSRRSRLREHEATLRVAEVYFSQLLDTDLEAARVLLERMEVVADEWVHGNLARPEVVASIRKAALAKLREAGG